MYPTSTSTFADNVHTANHSDRILYWQLGLNNDSFGYPPAHAAINGSEREREEIKRSILVWLPQTFTFRGRLRRWLRRLPCVPSQAEQVLGPEAILEAPS